MVPDQDRTGRIIFKLFDKDPSHFPGALRNQVIIYAPIFVFFLFLRIIRSGDSIVVVLLANVTMILTAHFTDL